MPKFGISGQFLVKRNKLAFRSMEVEKPKLFLRIFPSLKSITLVFLTLFCLEIFEGGARGGYTYSTSQLLPVNQNKAPIAFYAFGALTFNGFVTMLIAKMCSSLQGSAVNQISRPIATPAISGLIQLILKPYPKASALYFLHAILPASLHFP